MPHSVNLRYVVIAAFALFSGAVFQPQSFATSAKALPIVLEATRVTATSITPSGHVVIFAVGHEHHGYVKTFARRDYLLTDQGERRQRIGLGAFDRRGHLVCPRHYQRSLWGRF